MEQRDKIAVVRDSIQKLETFIDECRYIPASSRYRTIIVLALLSKCLTVGRAVCTLVETGFPEEAFGVARTLIDIYFIVRYISNSDSEQRAERFALFFAKNHEDWVKIVSKYYPHATVAPTDVHKEYLKIAQNYRSPNEWSGEHEKTRSLAMEPSTYEFDSNGNGITAAFDYEVLFKWTSHFVHSTVSGLESHFTEAGDVFKIRARVPSAKRGSDALFNVLVYASKIFVDGFRAMRDEQPAEILAEIREHMKSFL